MFLEEMGLSSCAKGCIACGVGTAVVFAIMIPVSLLVIAPKMGQHALDISEMNIPNATVFDIPDNLHLNHTAMMVNHVNLMQTSLPFSAKLHETQMVMHIPAYEGQWFSWPERNLAYFTMPELDIKHGTNAFSITSTITVMENTDDFVHWSFMLALGGFPYGTSVYIAGQPKLSALGGIISMELKMGKRMNCSYVPSPEDGIALALESVPLQTIEEHITARRLSGVGGMGPVTMTCKDEGEMHSDYLDVVLQNFTHELAQPGGGTTTPAPTTAPSMV